MKYKQGLRELVETTRKCLEEIDTKRAEERFSEIVNEGKLSFDPMKCFLELCEFKNMLNDGKYDKLIEEKPNEEVSKKSEKRNFYSFVDLVNYEDDELPKNEIVIESFENYETEVIIDRQGKSIDRIEEIFIGSIVIDDNREKSIDRNDEVFIGKISGKKLILLRRIKSIALKTETRKSKWFVRNKLKIELERKKRSDREKKKEKWYRDGEWRNGLYWNIKRKRVRFR